MVGPLDGYRVIAFTHFAAGPLAAQYLGALGADVVKVESPHVDVNRYAVLGTGDRFEGTSPYFLATNRNQRCIVVDLRNDEGRRIAQRLVSDADIVVENYRPGTLDKFDLGYEHVQQPNPGVIYCSLSAFDPDGPDRDKPGQDLLIQAVSGLAAASARGDGPPIPVGAYLVDVFNAAQGLIGILSALLHRERTGHGQRVTSDMMSSALFMQAQEAAFVLNGEPIVRPRSQLAHPQARAPYGIYQATDGYVALSHFGAPDAVAQLLASLGVDLELSASDLLLRRDEIVNAIARSPGLASRGCSEFIRLAEGAGMWAERVRSLDEALAGETVAQSRIVHDVTPESGPRYQVVTEPVHLHRTPVEHRLPAPAFGEHTVEVLQELGFTPEAIEHLLSESAVLDRPQ
jgi:crotonobetainyl-CoA:carnitine CoA-transferase CaiB-like acyl-CoA transferase